MADRGTYRVDLLPSKRQFSPAWLKPYLDNLLPTQKPMASGFNQTIETLHLGDEALAFAMYAGRFSAAGETITTTSPYLYEQANAPAKWQAEMHNLAWLKHFAASRRQLHNHFALRLLARWAKVKTPNQSLLESAKIIHALASDGANIARCSEPEIQSEFLKIVTNKISRFVRLSTHGAHEAAIKSIAILNAVSAFTGLEGFRKSAIEVLENAIDDLVLADGGIKNQAPCSIVEFLAVLLPLKKAMNQERQNFPPKTFRAIERMLGLLAMLRHGDGSLAFSHTANIANEKLNEFLASEEKTSAPMKSAPHSKLARLSKGKTLLVVKTNFDTAFEFSDGLHMVFTTSLSSEFPSQPHCELRDMTEGILLQHSNRTYFLSATGSDLRVEDCHSSPIELVFELSPNIKLTALRKSTDLLLLLPDRSLWKLSMRGAEARIEQNGRILRLLSTGQTCINWALKKQLRTSKTMQRKTKFEPDLLM